LSQLRTALENIFQKMRQFLGFIKTGPFKLGLTQSRCHSRRLQRSVTLDVDNFTTFEFHSLFLQSLLMSFWIVYHLDRLEGGRLISIVQGGI